MKHTICLLIMLTVTQVSMGQTKEITIKGSVSDGLVTLPDVNIRSVEDAIGTKTNKDGMYEIDASEGSTLRYSYVGYETVDIQLEDYDRSLNIVMVPKIETLDNVTVTEKVRTRKTQEQMFLEYNTNPNLIKTKFGIQDKEVSGTAMYMIEDKDINPVAMNILGVIQGKVPSAEIVNRETGLKTHIDDRNAALYLRRSEKPALYEIDGNLYEDTPFFLDINNIKRVAVLPSLFSATMYGTIGRGGIIIINTKSGNFSPETVDKPIYDEALVRNNNIENNIIEYSLAGNGAPTYLTELMEAVTFEVAKSIFEKHAFSYKGSIYFALDTYQYFYEERNNPKFADAIIDRFIEKFENTPYALKALAYSYQSQGRFKKANEVYKDLFVLRPNYSQSYIDLARSYRDLREFKKSAALHARYNYLVDEGFLIPDDVFEQIQKRDYRNLIKLEGEQITSNWSKKRLKPTSTEYNTLLLFEWNDSEAEFELQFVNPNGKYFKVEHSALANYERIRNQKIAGFSMEEQLLDDTLKGKWQVNIKYLGNKSLTPTYLKASVYNDYGLSSQKKETKLFRLGLKNVNQKLFEFVNSGISSTN